MTIDLEDLVRQLVDGAEIECGHLTDAETAWIVEHLEQLRAWAELERAIAPIRQSLHDDLNPEEVTT